MKISHRRKRQVLGFAAGIFISAITFVMLIAPGNDQWIAKGPMNTGHEDLSCESCHTPARGNVFQQMQANFMHTIGIRKSEADFGLQNVDNAKCINCHDRPNDRHPVHRFKEPRFSEVRKSMDPTQCESCHKEHSGVRFTLGASDYCQNCHKETELKNDPLEISHVKLVDNAMWSTCLQCHDFHGNHVFEEPTSLNDTIELARIIEYLDGAASPYGDVKKHYAKKEQDL